MEIITGGNEFVLATPPNSNKSWEIGSSLPLDRDVERMMEPFKKKYPKSGEYQKLSVKCTVEDSKGTIREIFKNITVQILDENDNLPYSQTKSDFVYVQLTSNFVHKVRQFMFTVCNLPRKIVNQM